MTLLYQVIVVYCLSVWIALAFSIWRHKLLDTSQLLRQAVVFVGAPVLLIWFFARREIFRIPRESITDQPQA